jgi:Kef-type K+ transport system membrane component KefB
MTEILNKYPEIGYIALLIGLFAVPRLLERWRIPGAITALALGVAIGPGLGFVPHDPALPFLAGLGIVALFLFAGMEVDLGAMRRHSRTVGVHVAVYAALLLAIAAGAARLGLDPRASVLVSLAIVTPSAGFILDSLPRLGLTREESRWVRTSVIASELVALAVLFVVMNSFDVGRFIGSATVLGAMIWGLPWLFRGFARFVDQAPRTEFAFLIVVALTCALITRLLGAYYLVGAFVVGLVTQRVRIEAPGRFSDEVMHAVELFAAFFIPFYFFKAGLHLEREMFTLQALGAGLGLLAVAVPVRVGSVMLQRRVGLGESWNEGFRIAMPLVPTLVFTLVLAQILEERFGAPAWLFGGLVVYTLANTVLPAMVFRAPTDYEAPHVDPPDETQEVPIDEVAALLRAGDPPGRT